MNPTHSHTTREPNQGDIPDPVKEHAPSLPATFTAENCGNCELEEAQPGHHPWIGEWAPPSSQKLYQRSESIKKVSLNEWTDIHHFAKPSGSEPYIVFCFAYLTSYTLRNYKEVL